MHNTYSAGVVTAYGAAKKAGYTGTYEEFCAEQAQFAQNAQQVREDKESVEQTVETFEETTVPAAVQAVTDEGITQVAAVNQAGATQVESIGSAGTTQVGNVNQAGSTQVAAVNQAGATQVQAVEDKGDEVIESIPQDYSELTAEVDELKNALDEIEETGKIRYVLPVNLLSTSTYKDKTSINADGEEYSIDNYATFGFIETFGVNKIYLTRAASSTTRAHENTLYAFYDENYSFISRPNRTTSVVDVPSGTKYVKFSIQRDYAIGNYSLMLEHADSGTLATSYSEFFEPYYSSLMNPLAHKKICSFGDSLAAGDNGDRTAKTWIDFVAEYFSADAYNRGIGSSCVTDETSAGVARTGYAYIDANGDAGQIRGVYSTQRTFENFPTEISPWMCNADRANTIPTDTDVVVIIAGTNDIGTVELDGFKMAYGQMLDNIIARVPNAKIYPCTLPFQQTYDLGSATDKATYNSYRQAIKEIASEYGFEFIDLRSEMGVNAQNYATYMSDVTHYATTKGKKKMAECVCKHLKDAIFIS